MSGSREAVKSVENATLFNDGTILLKNVRCSYPHLFKAYTSPKYPEQKPRFGINMLLPKGTHAAAMALIKGRNEELVKAAKIKIGPGKSYVEDGDESNDANEGGCWVLNAKSDRKPKVRDRDKSVIDSADADKIIGGYWVNVLIDPYVTIKYGRLGCDFQAVQFVREDEPFGKGAIRDEEVDDLLDTVPGDDDDI